MKAKLLRKVRKKICMYKRNKTYIIRRYDGWYTKHWYTIIETTDKELAKIYLRSLIIRYATELYGFRPKNKLA